MSRVREKVRFHINWEVSKDKTVEAVKVISRGFYQCCLFSWHQQLEYTCSHLANGNRPVEETLAGLPCFDLRVCRHVCLMTAQTVASDLIKLWA